MASVWQFVITIIIISFVSGTVMQLAPDGNLKKYMKFIVSLVLAIVLVSPAVIFINKINSAELNFKFQNLSPDGDNDYTEMYNKNYIASAEKMVSDTLFGAINDKFHIGAGKIKIEPHFEIKGENEILFSSAEITISEKLSASELDAVKIYLSALTDGKAEVMIDEQRGE